MNDAIPTTQSRLALVGNSGQTDMMPHANTALTRQQLHELAWSKPTTRIGAEFGVSPSAVTRACRKLNVPRPPVGYWVKIELGQSVPQTPLPTSRPGEEESTTFGEHVGKKRDLPKPETPVLPESLTEPLPSKKHPAVESTRLAYRDGSPYNCFGTIAARQGRHLSVSVTKDHLTRALEILNRLVWLLERNDFEFQDSATDAKAIDLDYRPTNTKIDFAIRESIERYEDEPIPAPDASGYIWHRWRYRSTGHLLVELKGYLPEGVRKSWKEGKRKRLEDMLSEIVEGFIVCAQGVHADHLENEALRRRWAAEAEVRAEIEQKRVEEEKRRTHLLEAARSWHQSQDLDKFVTACEAQLPPVTDRTPGDTLWLSWARSLAQAMDPLRNNFLSRAGSGQPRA